MSDSDGPSPPDWEGVLDYIEARSKAAHDPVQRFADAWTDWAIGPRTVPLPARWRSKVIALHRAGLSDADMLYAIDQAIHTTRPGVVDEKRFDYFVGVAFRRLGDTYGVSPKDALPSFTPRWAVPGHDERA